MLLRRARTADVRGIKALVDGFASDNILLRKPLVTLYETVQEFRVAVRGREVVGCGALHVLWEDLAESAPSRVDPSVQGAGSATRLVDELVARPGRSGCGASSAHLRGAVLRTGTASARSRARRWRPRSTPR